MGGQNIRVDTKQVVSVCTGFSWLSIAFFWLDVVNTAVNISVPHIAGIS
jgi:hypothetical protein